MSSLTRKWSVGILAVIGAALCLLLYPVFHSNTFNPRDLGGNASHIENVALVERILLFDALVLALTPQTRRAIASALQRLRECTASTRRWMALLVFMGSAPLLYMLGAARDRVMLPMWHDEGMYRMQTTFLSHGKFRMPGLPVPDSFDSPYIFVRGVYAPVYFPGTALLHVPAVLLHLPYWLTPLLIASVTLLLLFLIVSELIDVVAGVLAVLLLVSLTTFRWLALVEMSHAAGVMWGLVAMWAWLRWRQSMVRGQSSGRCESGSARAGKNVCPTKFWAMAGGLAAGWYAITRPLDAIVVLAPLALAWAWDLRRVGWRGGANTVIAVLLAAAPLLFVQLAFDRALTGHLLRAPLDVYNRIFFNARSLGLQHVDPSFHPPTPVPQIVKVYSGLDLPQMNGFTTPADAARRLLEERIPITLGTALPTLLLAFLVPLGLAGLTDRRRWVFWAMSWCYLAGAACFYIFLPHYTIAAAPAMIFAVLLGIDAIGQAWPRARTINVFLTLAVLFVAVQSILLNQQDFLEPFPGKVSRWNYFQLPKLVQKPAIVLYRFGPTEEPWEEPVYNWDVLWPDDAPIIRAHDLGPELNQRLFRYYAAKQPDRTVYSFDREKLQFKKLGNVKELAD